MALKRISSPLSAALIAAASAIAPLHGQDGFIQQPRLQKSSSESAKVERPAEGDATPSETEDGKGITTLPISPPKRGDQTMPPTSAADLTGPVQLAQPQTVPSTNRGAAQDSSAWRTPAEIERAAATPAPRASLGGVVSSNEPPLRWLTRGSSDTTAANLPLSQQQPAQSGDKWIDLDTNPTFHSAAIDGSRGKTDFYSSIPTVGRTRVESRGDTEAANVALTEGDARKQLASMVSMQIMSERTEQSRVISPVDTPPGWQAVGERLKTHMHACENLLRRNAFLSAREEAEAGILHLARVLDSHTNQFQCEPAWAAAEQAMKESEDFIMEQRLSSDQALMQRLIRSHQTPELKDAQLDRLSPLVAAQHYRSYAQKQLVLAAQRHPWSSEVFYTLGRTYQLQAYSGDERAETLRWRAITYFRTAFEISPSNSMAANELGYLMLQMDRPQDARSILITSVNLGPTPATLQNLAEAARRLQDKTTVDWAMQNLSAMNAAAQTRQLAAQPVIEVPTSTFAAASPRPNDR